MLAAARPHERAVMCSAFRLRVYTMSTSVKKNVQHCPNATATAQAFFRVMHRRGRRAPAASMAEYTYAASRYLISVFDFW